MVSRLLPWRRGSGSSQQQLPFTNDYVSDADLASDSPSSRPGSNAIPRSRPINAQNALSSSYRERNPLRSFAHQTSHSITDNPQYSSHGVRERTQQLASYALDSAAYHSPLARASSAANEFPADRPEFHLDGEGEGRASLDSTGSDSIAEQRESIPESPVTVIGPDYSRPSSRFPSVSSPALSRNDSPAVPVAVVPDTEETPLLPKPRLPRAHSQAQPSKSASPPAIHTRFGNLGTRFAYSLHVGREQWARFGRSVTNPKNYTKDAIYAGATTSLQMSSAVFLGLLLNILDALSYGYILFPLGSPIFSQTGPDGISIFFVSCIVSQLCYSLGLSIFRGGVGSEMIEVMPFFHRIAYSIMARMEGASAESIIATTIVAYCLSSIITGMIFLALGTFKLGNLVSFFPQHILIGCIGGVGFFLVVTGIEVSARLEGNLNYDLDTLHKLFSNDTVYLWILPLVLALLIIGLERRFKSPFLLPGFFIIVFATFYIIVKVILRLGLDVLRNSGWIFEQPEAGVPFYRFYSYFKFSQIDGAALASTIPTMFALSFFGIIHVPINVPALGAAVKEDAIDVNRELIAHGISNTLSGCVGSIQNYLVYANSILFINNGGDSRIAGVLLAAATTAVWMAGPAMIGFIPVCLVGALIFLLGIQLMKEAVWDTLSRLHKLEYFTVLAIVLIMGVYDFVIGIFAGIVLACLSYVVQSSRVPAIRATYSGDVAASTVRRPRSDVRYLSKVRGQIRVIKLSGFLFFGTIVSVEEYIRSLIDDQSFEQQPLSFIVVDFTHVTDVDFSSSEGFQRINRLLGRKGVKMIISGISFASRVGQALQNVGLLDTEIASEECPPPQVFEDLNMALESCENELLETFYQHCNSPQPTRQRTPPKSIEGATSSGDTWNASPSPSLNANTLLPEFSSPRRGAQYLAATTTFREQGRPAHSSSNGDQEVAPSLPSKWKNFSQPTKIILQTFEDVSSKNEDFWHVLAPYFERREYPRGTVLYSRGDEPDGFYVVEKGRLRADYEFEQGNFSENIMPGTTCGELPFFSETDRTGTVAAEEESVAWLLTREKYNELEQKNRDVAAELLKVGLKLTKERMDAITSYVLVTAS
ncbi:sulfate transporter family protein-like protein [Bimuria novae-zelandiae CBS 107.79]|uniref:Sulfate transporter family protein-like protein n=1 Tax=Bimuria novae-zelandiae CBS 107.79 TaxID=1447943 RepID=A0A6A5V0G9_9PLEO|nr:sulfate transporter family protein-like protein [Bimuria novae-zelandiae CBS 107.79]